MLRYVSNIAARIHPETIESREFAKSLGEIADELALDVPHFRGTHDSSTYQDRHDRDRRPSASEWLELQQTIINARGKSSRYKPDYLTRRIGEFADLMGLNQTDVSLLEFFLYYETDPNIEYCVDEILEYQAHSRSRFSSFSTLNPNLANLIGVSHRRIQDRLRVDSPLTRIGIVAIDESGEISLLKRIRRLAYEPAISTQPIHQMLFDKASSTELEWRDFDHVESARDHIEGLIVGALAKGEKGVNVLVHGPPGTGKTEFCKTLAKRLGISLFSIGESDERGREPSRGERLQELRLAQRMLGATRNSVLLFDEMEDLLLGSRFSVGWYGSGRQRSTQDYEGSKVFLHRLLERNAVPILWTSNSARYTNPALLRRMMYAFELRRPSRPIRARIWRRQLERHGIHSTHENAESLARDFDVTPGVVDRAVAAARLIDGGGLSAVCKGVESLSRLIHGPKPPQTRIATFEPNLVCSNLDVIDLSDRLATRRNNRFALCLRGPPGTGKSAFVRYLSERLGLEVLQKRTSDLLSMWVGETETKIAEAFAEARDREQFLVFDEAESLLADRRFAHRNWEISQVNEMLTWMESHPMPFACTTNYGERLDPATLRRFDFKLSFDYLSAERLGETFKTFFRMTAPTELEALTNLTPGDFAIVKRRAEVLGKEDDAEVIVCMLKEESEFKPERINPIGFRGV